LTSYPKPSQFERVVQALIFTLFIQALVVIIEYILVTTDQYWNFGQWNESLSLIASIPIAILCGITADKVNRELGKRSGNNGGYWGSSVTPTYVPADGE